VAVSCIGGNLATSGSVIPSTDLRNRGSDLLYVSTACVKHNRIDESVLHLAQMGYRNIELSGGTQFYDGFENDLLRLRSEFGLNYFLHNYFPPPTEHFVLNLASMNDGLYLRCIEHCKQAIALCHILGSERFSVHAGFLIDFSPQEAGKKVNLRKLTDRQPALERFCEAWYLLQQVAGDGVRLYIENNVLSHTNAVTFGDKNPFLLTDTEGYTELKGMIDFHLLLDLAHLKVSAHTLQLDFQGQVSSLMPKVDYLHVSGNDGLHDQNLGVQGDTDILRALKRYDVVGKAMTLEVYDGMESILDSTAALQDIRDGYSPLRDGHA
jgi:sugar phosphate isomerase/epimerase